MFPQPVSAAKGQTATQSTVLWMPMTPSASGGFNGEWTHFPHYISRLTILTEEQGEVAR